MCAHPLPCLQWKVAPALAAGNSCVLKPSEMASVTCLELAELAAQAGVPAGVLNVVTGLGADAGAPLRCGEASTRRQQQERRRAEAVACC